jgi:hypothetical protein
MLSTNRVCGKEASISSPIFGTAKVKFITLLSDYNNVKILTFWIPFMERGI